MPLELQKLSPKPDFDVIADPIQIRVPKLAVRDWADKRSPTIASTTPPSPTQASYAGKENESKETLFYDDETPIVPHTPTSPANSTCVAPWETEAPGTPGFAKERKFEPRPPTAHSSSFTVATNERHSSELLKQPFRGEVFSRVSTRD
jgi:hypothetical protein